MQIIEKRLNELRPYENNPRNNSAAVGDVANSISEFGFKVPIIIDKDGVIVAGHTRYLAALELGMSKVPTIMADDLSPKQIKAFRIADNKTAEKAAWDKIMLGEEVSDLIDDFDFTDFGFNEAELIELTIDDSGLDLFVPDAEYESGGEYIPPSTTEGISRTEANMYAEKADSSSLVTKRVILIYRTEEDEAYIKQALGIEDGELGVIYDISKMREDAE